MNEMQDYLINKGLLKSLKIEVKKGKTRITPESPMSYSALLGELLLILIQHYLCNAEKYKNKYINEYAINILKILIDIMEDNSNEKWYKYWNNP